MQINVQVFNTLFAHLNKIVIVEEFVEYAMEEDEIQLDQVDQRITTYKIDDRHSLLQDLLQLFITLFNTTTNSMQIINSLFNYFEIHQIDPSFIFNQFAYQDYNFSRLVISMNTELELMLIIIKLFEYNFNLNNYIIGKGADMDKPLAFKLFLNTAEIEFNIGKIFCCVLLFM
ncbi:hypothetical protein F8M41_019425 [Gigaspora margarita]|uniref:Uncharacterized protein n=1 Tax=Gigaspora margarita TaxID=4874 RepID=A0A8H4B2E2_GIGMA|nr:hypothetical protein F8M41_019425 [Gigaspora margarita]